jgi:hypothetical protein
LILHFLTSHWGLERMGPRVVALWVRQGCRQPTFRVTHTRSRPLGEKLQGFARDGPLKSRLLLD